MFKLLSELFAPPDSESGVIEDKALSKEEAIKFMDDETEDEKIDLAEPKKETKEETTEEETTEKEPEETDELKEIEEELEEPKIDDDLELVVPARRKDILAKYPNLFKDFPYLERAYYKEQKITELLPTMEDVQTAVDKSQALDNFEAELLKGDTKRVLAGVKEVDPEAFNKIVDNYLPTLKGVDERAYYHVVGSLINQTIVKMVEESRRSKNESLEVAAQLLNQFVFGTSDFQEIKPLTIAKKDNTEEERLKEREKQLVQRQFEDARDSLSTRIDNVVKSTIESNIDPRQSMTDYVRKNAIREAKENLTSQIEGDRQFKVLLDKLWDRAFNNGFKREDLDRIKSAYLSKAKTLMPDVIKKARNEALRGLGKRVRDDSEEESTKKGHAPVGKSTTSSNSGKSSKEQANQIPSGMKTLDFLMKD